MSRSRAVSRDTPLLEWTAALLGFLIAVVVLGLVAREALSDDGGPPVLRAEVQEVHATSAGFVVRVRVRNLGEASAAQVRVEARTASGEQGAITFDYVPARSSREGGVVIAENPRIAGLQLRVAGFADP